MAKHKRPSYYAVRVGRKPGVYDNWGECEKQVSRFSGAVFKGFVAYDDALAFVGDAIRSTGDEAAEEIDECAHNSSRAIPLEDSTGCVSVKGEDTDAFVPPPASQSYFDQFPEFITDNKASFEDEFTRFASSQGLVSGSQEYRRQRTRAIRDELKFHYSSQSNDAVGIARTIPEFRSGLSKEHEILDIYKNMCREIGVTPRDTITECRRELKGVLVNIVDYIDARRIGKKVKIWDWDDFHRFCEYSLQDGKRIDINEAKADGGFLSALLQRLTGPGPRRPASVSVSHGGAKRKRPDYETFRFSKRVRTSAPYLKIEASIQISEMSRPRNDAALGFADQRPQETASQRID